ncbi:hypothetical protein GH714_026173 [Hevea brasiliensis]|uniref:Uncharacterized protein n=1 Tax=Hevea brasiliensis TaxID=3981 RepID=A0A6A6M5Q3_HEVBR|nr:hypothetical protein GH714_026173 [Hevea brasiliensis]
MDRKSSCCGKSYERQYVTTPKKEVVKPVIEKKKESGTGQVENESPVVAAQVKSEVKNEDNVKKEKVPEKVRVSDEFAVTKHRIESFILKVRKVSMLGLAKFRHVVVLKHVADNGSFQCYGLNAVDTDTLLQLIRVEEKKVKDGEEEQLLFKDICKQIHRYSKEGNSAILRTHRPSLRSQRFEEALNRGTKYTHQWLNFSLNKNKLRYSSKGPHRLHPLTMALKSWVVAIGRRDSICIDHFVFKLANSNETNGQGFG